MDLHTLHVLEFDKVKEILKGFASSALGKELITDLHPQTQVWAVRESLAETAEMVQLYDAKQPLPLDGLYDVRTPLKQSTLPGAMLEPADILLIGETVTAARRIRSCLNPCQLEVKRIRSYLQQLIPHKDIEEAINRVFDEQKNIRDQATPDLLKIRKAMRQQRASIVRRLEKLIRGSWRDYLQENFHTQRDGRYVLPVDARYQNKVPGIIHDRSATGTTVYIEPLELVEDSNFLKSMIREEEIEIRRILQDLTTRIATCADDLTHNLQIFAQLDFLSAKARFSQRFDMNTPRITEGHTVSIVNARHPLLLAKHGRDHVVPLNLVLDESTKGIVVTGPNTGGKTVVLKTVGLLVLMAQSGLPIPADATTELPGFESVGADIGDEQSLEQSLSTFSSHIQTIRRVLETADRQSLVLLDELGSGTDPAEGGALSCSILEQLHEKQATYLVTTHLQELKLFAFEKEGVKNGSMEFDLQTLRPTFRFMMGLPGKSNAIQIADRLGLPTSVIQRARLMLDQGGDSPEEILTRLGDELRTAQSLRINMDRERAKARQYKEEANQRLHKAKREAAEILKRSERKAQHLLHELERRLKQLERKEAEFQREWEEKLKSILADKPEEKPKSILKEVQNLLHSSKQKIKEAAPQIKQTYKRKRNWKFKQLKPGVLVQLEGVSEPAEVLSVSKNQQEIEVTVSSMVLRVPPARIEALLKRKPQPADSLFNDVKVDRPDTLESSVDVHGMTVEEMTPIIEKYIDKAFLAGLRSVTIIHGHGMGVLRRAVRNLLRENPVVKHIHPGMDFEGGTGVTVVQLKSSR